MRHHELSLTGLNFPACLRNLDIPDPSMHTRHTLCTHSTRNVEAFFKRTAIAYHPNLSERAKFWWDAIAVFLKKTLRYCEYDTSWTEESAQTFLGQMGKATLGREA